MTHINKQTIPGFVHGIDAMSVGTVAHHLGAGRQKPGDQINHAVGVELKSQVGDFVSKGMQFSVFAGP